MNDRHKFRVWCKTHKQWEKDEICINNYGLYIIKNSNPNFLKITNNDPQFHVINFCTGLKDRNGKLIFEGDIVKQSDGCIGFIVWQGVSYWIESPGSSARDLESVSYYETVEVIGNIYENPEILENCKALQ